MLEITEEMWTLVEERIKQMPSHIKLSIGNVSYNRAELVNSVKKRDEVGELIAQMEITYMKALKTL